MNPTWFSTEVPLEAIGKAAQRIVAQMKVILDGMTYSVGPKGQVVIPKHLRDSMGIRPGNEILFEQRGDEVILRKAGSQPLKGRFAGRALTDALLDARREDKELE